MTVRFRGSWKAALLVALPLSFAAGTALAGYLGTGKFASNQMFRCHSGSYATPNQNASAKWSATTDLDNFYSCSGNNITTIGANYGATGWFGMAYICGASGCNTSTVLANTYTSCQARSNTNYLSTWTDTQRQFNATHELGHCWSLAHDSRTGSVMRSGQLSIVDPDAGNVSDVNARY